MQSYENDVRALFIFTKLEKYHTIENKMKTSIRYCWTVFLINLQIEKYPISTKLIPIYNRNKPKQATSLVDLTKYWVLYAVRFAYSSTTGILILITDIKNICQWAKRCKQKTWRKLKNFISDRDLNPPNAGQTFSIHAVKWT